MNSAKQKRREEKRKEKEKNMLNMKKSGSDFSEKPERTDSKGRKRVGTRTGQSQRSSSVTKQ